MRHERGVKFYIINNLVLIIRKQLMITYGGNIVAVFDKISNFVDVKIFVLI